MSSLRGMNTHNRHVVPSAAALLTISGKSATAHASTGAKQDQCRAAGDPMHLESLQAADGFSQYPGVAWILNGQSQALEGWNHRDEGADLARQAEFARSDFGVAFGYAEPLHLAAGGKEYGTDVDQQPMAIVVLLLLTFRREVHG